MEKLTIQSNISELLIYLNEEIISENHFPNGVKIKLFLIIASNSLIVEHFGKEIN